MSSPPLHCGDCWGRGALGTSYVGTSYVGPSSGPCLALGPQGSSQGPAEKEAGAIPWLCLSLHCGPLGCPLGPGTWSAAQGRPGSDPEVCGKATYLGSCCPTSFIKSWEHSRGLTGSGCGRNWPRSSAHTSPWGPSCLLLPLPRPTPQVAGPPCWPGVAAGRCLLLEDGPSSGSPWGSSSHSRSMHLAPA